MGALAASKTAKRTPAGGRAATSMLVSFCLRPGDEGRTNIFSKKSSGMSYSNDVPANEQRPNFAAAFPRFAKNPMASRRGRDGRSRSGASGETRSAREISAPSVRSSLTRVAAGEARDLLRSPAKTSVDLPIGCLRTGRLATAPPGTVSTESSTSGCSLLGLDAPRILQVLAEEREAQLMQQHGQDETAKSTKTYLEVGVAQRLGSQAQLMQQHGQDETAKSTKTYLEVGVAQLRGAEAKGVDVPVEQMSRRARCASVARARASVPDHDEAASVSSQWSSARSEQGCRGVKGRRLNDTTSPERLQESQQVCSCQMSSSAAPPLTQYSLSLNLSLSLLLSHSLSL